MKKKLTDKQRQDLEQSKKVLALFGMVIDPDSIRHILDVGTLKIQAFADPDKSGEDNVK